VRKWLDKAWAKAAAFVLTLVLGGLTVLGGIGIGILVSYNVFLDDGAYLRQTLYQEQCYDSLSMANDYLCAQLDSVGLLDKSYYFVNTDAADSAEYNPEAAQQLLSELPRLFADAFSRELSSCQLVVSDPDTGETYLANFDLTESDKLLYDTQELYVYHLSESTGLTSIQVAITATLLEKSGQAPSYSYLVCSWLLTHTGLTIFLTVLCGLLTLFCFCFSMAAAGHWHGGHPPDMAGQGPRRRVRAGAAKRLLHRMGRLLFRMGAGSFLCSADTGHAAVPVCLCRPV